MLQAICFDFYGTLVEINHDVPRFWEILTSWGYSCPPELEAAWNSDGFNGMETPRFDTRPSYEDWRLSNLCSMAQQSGVPNEKIVETVHYLLAVDREWTVRAKRGAPEMLRYLRDNGIRVGICSNWDYALLPYMSQAALPEVDVVITSAEVGARKPHPRLFLTACDILNLPPKDIWFVGNDWSTDVVGALRVGMQPIWLTQEKINPLPRLVRSITDFSELEKLINNHPELAIPTPRCLLP